MIVPANKRMGLYLQFQITEPLAGDVVGVEATFSYGTGLTPGIAICPVFFRAHNAAVALMGNIYSSDFPMYGRSQDWQPTSSPYQWVSIAGREQYVVGHAPVALLPGTYCHGITVWNTTGADYTLYNQKAYFGIRQLNDQQGVGYRDTLR